MSASNTQIENVSLSVELRISDIGALIFALTKAPMPYEISAPLMENLHRQRSLVVAKLEADALAKAEAEVAAVTDAASAKVTSAE